MSTLIKQMGRLSVATVLIMMWGCGGASQEQEVSLETTDARLSYGIGLRMGQRMAADGMTVDVAAYAAGLEDAMTGAEAKLTDEEINTEMSAFQERREAEAGAERVALAQSNLEAGSAYHGRNEWHRRRADDRIGSSVHRDGARRGRQPGGRRFCRSTL